MASDPETRAFLQRKVDDFSRQIERLQLQRQVVVDMLRELEEGMPRSVPIPEQPPLDEATLAKMEAMAWQAAQAEVSPMSARVKQRRSEPR
jgi:hypothetical protein